MFLDRDGESEEDGSTEYTPERAIKCSKISSVGKTFAYIDARFLLRTPILCKMLFPIANHALTNRWKVMLSSNVESQILLYVNPGSRGVQDVKRIEHE